MHPGPCPPRRKRRALTDAQSSLRAQMLATEHWSLLASRVTTQSEVLTRIAIFLTLVSAGLVTLGVLGNATQFSGWFGVAALGVLFLLVLLGRSPCCGCTTRRRRTCLRPRDESPAGRLHRPRSGHRAVFHDVVHRRSARAERPIHFSHADRARCCASSMMIIPVVTPRSSGCSPGASRSHFRRRGRRRRHHRHRRGACDLRRVPDSPGTFGLYFARCASHVPLRTTDPVDRFLALQPGEHREHAAVVGARLLEAELLEDRADVLLHGADPDEELLRDARVACGPRP